jgi:hypothetical protein
MDYNYDVSTPIQGLNAPSKPRYRITHFFVYVNICQSVRQKALSKQLLFGNTIECRHKYTPQHIRCWVTNKNTLDKPDKDMWPSCPHLTASDRGRCFVECPLMNTWQLFVVNFPSIFCHVKRIISRLLFAGCQGLTPDKRPYFFVFFSWKRVFPPNV